jgi:hypothetical protein
VVSSAVLSLACSACGRSDPSEGASVADPLDVPGYVFSAFRSVQLPSGFRAAGLAIAAHGHVIVWADSGGRLVLIDSSGAARLHGLPAEGRVIGARWVGNTELEVVTTTQLLSLRSDGTVTATRALELPEGIAEAIAAVPCEAVWCIGGADVDRSYWISVPGRGGPQRLLGVMNYEYAARPRALQLAVRWPWLYVTSARPPYSVVRVNALDGKRRALVPRYPEELTDATGGQPPEYRALRLVPFDGGFLQTWADLRSDTRVLVVLNDSLATVATRRIEAPLAFVAAGPDGQVVAAIRSLGAQELVLYRVGRPGRSGIQGNQEAGSDATRI